MRLKIPAQEINSNNLAEILQHRFFPFKKLQNEQLYGKMDFRDGLWSLHIEHVVRIVININIWTVSIARVSFLEVENFRFSFISGKLIFFFFFFGSCGKEGKAHRSSYEKFYRVSIFISTMRCFMYPRAFKNFRRFLTSMLPQGRKLFQKNWRHTTEISKNVSLK